MDRHKTQISDRYHKISIQNVSQSKITQFDDPKNSRILDRKQIQKRLQSLKPHEYQKVTNNLTSQNRRLKQQMRDLKQKIEQLMISKKISNPHHRNPLMEEQVKKAKKQLALKYESMSFLKEELQKAKQTEVTEEMRLKAKQQKQQLLYAEEQIKKLNREKQKLLQHLAVNRQSLEDYNPSTKNQDERMEKLREENKDLKTQIQVLNAEHKATEKKSKQTLDKLYNLKHSEQKFLAILLETKMSKSSNRKFQVTDAKEVDANEINALQQQVQSLKRQKKQAQKQLANEKMNKQTRKERIQKEARKNLEIHKELLHRRMKAINELNLFESKDRKQKEVIQKKQQKKEQLHCEQRGYQTDKIIPIDFRKEWIGKSEGLLFDDSQVLDYRSHVYIKAFIIYKTQNFIGFVKFFYENSQKKRYESKIPFDASCLRKYESKKYTGKGQSYLKQFKVFLTHNIITGIAFTWSDGEVVSEGYQLESSTKFISDIQAQERPISMFGSVSFQNKNIYALESLGCQVNRIDTDQ